ncbi:MULTISPECIES: response regulator receiver domain [Alteromonas]|uniref:response regulator receiver domain n=1 Tax=unclassified Alteromonas TaxID=2614992 RepID=UPI000C4666DE|nr:MULTISPECIES: response regulator receiver domain [Alteromonas]MAN43122.1 hypothetical protein [Alteromonas sp.]MAW03399.1 hypothetical protein [Alteromonas sp.]MCG7635872.1 response regulator receiver domain [Alteromonas sp. CNT1-28]MCG7812924.1 response regulator receiver domain [Alteromonas sp. MCA-1]RZP32216.1 MAG: hypothetical protein EVA22_09285 [Alteromonas sp.]|tara:strand:- start:796 stop:2424 length:1629 start_codon:yes stop_codon:yes gene_type:complete
MSFRDKSNEIANEFLQTVVFLDDKAYGTTDQADINHDFDVKSVVKSFAHNKKVCSVFQPEVENDIHLFTEIAQKADVVVLDWRIIIDIEDSEELDDEEDAVVDDHNGHYTKQIINKLLESKSSQNSLKLIVIYTGNPELQAIAASILQSLQGAGIDGFSINQYDECSINSHSCKILVRAKSNGGLNRGQHAPELIEKSVTYEELPEFINSEFAEMTNGLLSNFALKALAAIRENSFQIINVFSKNLDYAYLANQSLLINNHDANELLVDLIGDTFVSILRANDANSLLDTELISIWLEDNLQAQEQPSRSKSGELEEKTFSVSVQNALDLLSSCSDVKEKFVNTLGELNNLSKGNVGKNYKAYAFDIFSDSQGYGAHQEYAKLCQHKNLIHNQGYIPFLSLGTVVKSTHDGKYFVCIQQRCDSVRIANGDIRRFLFISLDLVDHNSPFDFITPNGEKLYLNRKTYDLKTIKFLASDDGSVRAERDQDSLIFKQFHQMEDGIESFEYLFELKELYAQRIVDDYSSGLSRVGLDEPEWVRLSKR